MGVGVFVRMTRQLRLKLLNALRPQALLPFGFFRVVTQHVAAPPLPVADEHFLGVKVLLDDFEPTWRREDLLFDLRHAGQARCQQVFPASPTQRRAVLPGVHPGIGNKQGTTQLPTTQIRLDPLDRGDVRGLARKDPATNR